MTPKEKAKELRDKMYLKIPSVYDPTGLPHYPIAKQMALIAVDELINYLTNRCCEHQNRKYWESVKIELEKL